MKSTNAKRQTNGVDLLGQRYPMPRSLRRGDVCLQCNGKTRQGELCEIAMREY